MSSVLEEMLSIRDKFEAQDRKDAMNVLMWVLNYEIPFRASQSNTFVLFQEEPDIKSFCVNNNLKISALKRLLDEMRSEGLVEPQSIPVTFTPLGVEKLCRVV